MGFIKVVKTNAYYKRFQTQFRRRREGKTDYYARKRLVVQNKDKYNSPKYRLVARITSGKVIAQIIYATIKGDRVVTQANSAELKKFGLTAGLTNYSSCYATGLLIARRLLTQLKMTQFYPGTTEVNGEKYDVSENPHDDRRPFKCFLDTGLKRTTTGSRVFGVLKGAVDGGLYVPHSTKRFPGYYPGEEKGDAATYEAEVHRDRIFGCHVDIYMKHLKEESSEDYQAQFSNWDKCLKAAKVESVEALMTKVFEQIRANPTHTKKAAPSKPNREHSKYRTARIGRAQRKVRALKKIEIQTQQQ